MYRRSVPFEDYSVRLRLIDAYFQRVASLRSSQVTKAGAQVNRSIACRYPEMKGGGPASYRQDEM